MKLVALRGIHLLFTSFNRGKGARGPGSPPLDPLLKIVSIEYSNQGRIQDFPSSAGGISAKTCEKKRIFL